MIGLCPSHVQRHAGRRIECVYCKLGALENIAKLARAIVPSHELRYRYVNADNRKLALFDALNAAGIQ